MGELLGSGVNNQTQPKPWHSSADNATRGEHEIIHETG
jgi:hypothetical protein